MANSSIVNQLNQHYLQVQALTPIKSSPEVSSNLKNSKADWYSATSPAIMLFFVLLIAGMITLLITRTRNSNKILVVVGLAFMTSMIPLGLRALSSRTEVLSQATANYTPQNLIIDQVTSNSFNLSWQTGSPNIGSIRLYRLNPNQTLNRIISENGSSPVYTHFINVTGLNADSTYAFQVLSAESWYDNQGQPLVVATLR